MTTNHEAQPAYELPNDRTLALHEIHSLTEQLRNANLHVYTAPDWRRDRIIGWILTVVILVGLGWAVFYNYVSSQDLRHSLYQSCLDANARNAAQHDLYIEVGRLSKDPKFVTLLGQTSAKLSPVDCAGRYL